MSSFTSKTLISVVAGAVAVSAHGHVNSAIVDGVEFQGYDVFSMPYMSDPPVVIGWANDATDNGFVLPDAMDGPDIICHRNAENARGHAVVQAGSSIMLQWDTWPESHHGPVIDYLAACGDSCESVDKTSLEFFKIGEMGLIDGSNAPGRWASDLLMDNGNAWVVTIPEGIAPGNYVLRHEIIGLHEGFNENGAQLYPQCFNLQVVGSGSDQPAGVLGTELYTFGEEGIHFDIYKSLDSYPIPGPALYSGAADVVQEVIQATATSSAATDNSIPTAVADTPATTAVDEAPAVTTTEAPVEEPTETEAPAATTTTTAAEPTKTPCSRRRHRKHRRSAGRA